MKKNFISLLSICAFGISSLFAQVPTNGLLIHYKFDGNLDDDSGNGRTSSLFNNQTAYYGGSALHGPEDGDGNALYNTQTKGVQYDYSSEASAFQTQDLTYAMWVNPSDLGNGYSNLIENGTGDQVCICDLEMQTV